MGGPPKVRFRFKAPGRRPVMGSDLTRLKGKVLGLRILGLGFRVEDVGFLFFVVGPFLHLKIQACKV